MSNVYAGLGNGGRKLYLYEADRKTKVRQILWGDWLKVDGEEADGWLRITWSPKTNPRMLFIPKADTIANRPLEIVFLDVGMPGLSGYELAPRLRALPGMAGVSIVAVTGWGQPEDRRRTREAGFDEHLVKPPALEAIQGLCSTPAHARRTAESSSG